jgi:hypothetical protein
VTNRIAILLALTLAAVAAAVLPVGSARAAIDDCDGVDPGNGPDVSLMRVRPAHLRLYFINSPGKTLPDCPSGAQACRLKAFLVPGDLVLVQRTEESFVCATYRSQRGAVTEGWLPFAALEAVDVSVPPRVSAWAGRWVRDEEARITLTPRADVIAIDGVATSGATDPARVQQGAVNTGVLEGSVEPQGNMLALGEGYDGTRPPAAGSDCVARLRLFARYLVAEDNNTCGGNNVSFTGVYVRSGR